MEITGFYKEVLKTLIDCEVDFLLVGGLAVGFYGYARYTGDMDLWLSADHDNLNKLGEALKSLKYEDDIIHQILNERPINHPTPIRLIEENNIFKVNLMTTIYYEPLTFDACRSRSTQIIIDNFNLPIIGLNDLIEIKSNTKRYNGNMKDLVDAQELRKILAKSEIKPIQKKPSFFQELFAKIKKPK